MSNIKKDRERSEVQYGPRPIGDIVTEMLQSNSPLAQGYRKFQTDSANAEKGDIKNG